MNTSLPLLNVITGSQSAATGSRSANPADSFSADAPFNQVLNSQVNNRNAENQSQDKPRAAEEPAKPSQPTQTAAAAKPADSDATKKQDADKDDDESDDTTTTQASAELLALVANLAQNAVKPVSNSKGEDTQSDLLAQAKRNGGKLSPQGDDQPLALDAKDKKIDFAGLQSAVNANNAKKEAAPDLTAQNADVAARASKSDKPAIDLSADTKNTPKEDANALAAKAQGTKLTAEVLPAKQDAAQTTPSPLIMPAMQQALAANQPQAVFPTGYTDKIQPNVGSAGWDQAVGQKITWMVSGGIQSASLTLNPPDLGPMQVVLNVHNQQADATFITAQPEVKQALEAAMPKLREMMDQAGIQLGQATVNTGMPNQQQGANGQQQQGRSSSSSRFGQDDEGDIAVAATGNAAVTSSGLGLVDTFV